MKFFLVSPQIASISVRVDYSLLAKHLFQATQHFVLVGVEDYMNDGLTTMEKFERPRACDIRFATLPSAQQRGGWWTALKFPLEPREKIRTFRLNETNGLLAVITWFDEPVSQEGKLRMRLRIKRFPKLEPMPGAATQEFPFEITARNNESSPDAWIDIREDLIGVRVHEIEESTLRVYDWRTGMCRLEDRCPRGSQGTTFVFLQDEAIAVASRDSSAVSILTIPDKDSATATPPYPKLTAAIRTLKISQEYLPPPGRNSLFPAFDDDDDLPPPPEGELDIIFPSVNCFSSTDSNIVIINIISFGRSTDIAIHSETLRSFSAYASPLFPSVSVGQYVGDAGSVGQVIIPWEDWGKGKAEVFTEPSSGESMVDGSWYATLSRDRRLKIHDFGSWWGAGPQPSGSGGKVILDEFVDYHDAVVQFRENRVLALILKERGDEGWFSSIDVYLVSNSRDKENRSDPTYDDIAPWGSELATTS